MLGLASSPAPSPVCPLLSPSGGPRQLSASHRDGSWSGRVPAHRRSMPSCGAAGSGSPSSATASRMCTPGCRPWPGRPPSTWTSWARRWPSAAGGSQQPQPDLRASKSPSACGRGRVRSGREGALFSRLGSVTAIIFIIPWLCLLPVLGMTLFREGGIGTPGGDNSGIQPCWFPSAPRLPLLHAAVTSTCSCGRPPSPEVTLLTWWW